MKKIVFVVLIFIITACTPVATSLPQSTSARNEVLPTETLTLTATPKPSLTPTQTFTPTVTATATPAIIPLSNVDKESLMQAYKIMFFIHTNANLLSQTATKVKEGELTGFDSFGALITLAALVNATDKAIPSTTVPEIMAPYWEEALPIHAATKDLVAKWFNKEIDSTVVIEEVAPYLTQIESILSKQDKELASVYGFDEQEMSKSRKEVIQSIDDIFVTQTPAP